MPIVVAHVVLYKCNNVGFMCGENKMETTVEPGKRKVVLEVEPGSSSRPINFSYRYQWRHKSRDAVLSALASGGDSAAARQQRARCASLPWIPPVHRWDGCAPRFNSRWSVDRPLHLHARTRSLHGHRVARPSWCGCRSNSRLVGRRRLANCVLPSLCRDDPDGRAL